MKWILIAAVLLASCKKCVDCTTTTTLTTQSQPYSTTQHEYCGTTGEIRDHQGNETITVNYQGQTVSAYVKTTCK